MSAGADRTYFFDGGPKHGQRVDTWEGIEWLQVYREPEIPLPFDWGAKGEGEEDPSQLRPIDIGWYRVMGNCLLWEGWESETANVEVQDHDHE